MKKKYIVTELVGWQFGAVFYSAGSEVELTDAEYKEFTEAGVKLKPKDEKSHAKDI